MSADREEKMRADLKRHLRELREGLTPDDPRAKRLNTEFKRKKCSQSQIAEYLGLNNYSRYQRYEDPLTEAVPTALELKRLGELYGCSLDFFFEAYAEDESFEHDERRSSFTNELFQYKKADLLLDAYYRYQMTLYRVLNFSGKAANHYELLHDYEVSLRQPSYRPVFLAKLAKAMGIDKRLVFDKKNNLRIQESDYHSAFKKTLELDLSDEERHELQSFIYYEEMLFLEHGLRASEYELIDLFMEFVREG